jgi:hypothetical protein
MRGLIWFPVQVMIAEYLIVWWQKILQALVVA